MAKIKQLSLTFAQRTHHLNAFYCSVSCLHRFKPQRRADNSLQFAMIAFDNVVPVLNLSVLNVRRASTFALEKSKRTAIGGRLIRID